MENVRVNYCLNFAHFQFLVPSKCADLGTIKINGCGPVKRAILMISLSLRDGIIVIDQNIRASFAFKRIKQGELRYFLKVFYQLKTNDHFIEEYKFNLFKGPKHQLENHFHYRYRRLDRPTIGLVVKCCDAYCVHLRHRNRPSFHQSL